MSNLGINPGSSAANSELTIPNFIETPPDRQPALLSSPAIGAMGLGGSSYAAEPIAQDPHAGDVGGRHERY